MISGSGMVSSLLVTASFVRWVGSVEFTKVTLFAMKLNVLALLMFSSMVLDVCQPDARYFLSMRASILVMVSGSLCLACVVQFFLDLRDRPWWKYQVVPSWRMIPCFGSGIVSLRNSVAFALCLNHGWVMEGERPSVDGVVDGS